LWREVAYWNLLKWFLLTTLIHPIGFLAYVYNCSFFRSTYQISNYSGIYIKQHGLLAFKFMWFMNWVISFVQVTCVSFQCHFTSVVKWRRDKPWYKTINYAYYCFFMWATCVGWNVQICFRTHNGPRCKHTMNPLDYSYHFNISWRPFGRTKPKDQLLNPFI
jgi:hypothetical protein